MILLFLYIIFICSKTYLYKIILIRGIDYLKILSRLIFSIVQILTSVIYFELYVLPFGDNQNIEPVGVIII